MPSLSLYLSLSLSLYLQSNLHLLHWRNRSLGL